MKRPTGWAPNPQAMASAANRKRADTDTWLTPRYILDYLGRFDLDPCGAHQRPDWTGCQKQFTSLSDGLAASWEGRVFCNPPFSNAAPWIERCSKHRNGITLVAASIESIAWRKFVWPSAKAVLLLHGRTRFANLDGSQTTGRPLRSIALIAWTDSDRLVLEGSPLAGVLLTDWRQR